MVWLGEYTTKIPALQYNFVFLAAQTLINKEEARTTVMVKDTETLVIAGLIRDKTTDIIKKTPVVGDIPVFGYLFRKKEKTVAKTDIIIFLTPHIITAELDDE